MDLFAQPTPTRKPIGGHQSARSETCVWLTPPEIIAALGPFDLDPCACSEPRPWSTAAEHWTVEDDGLAKAWNRDKRIFMNPPYGPPPVTGPWMRRMAAHGHGTALIFARTETAIFFSCVWKAATAILFIEGRLHFHYPDGRRAKANSGAPSVLVAYGEEDARRLKQSGIAGHFVVIEHSRNSR